MTISNPVTQSLYIDGIARWIIPEPISRDNGYDAAKKLSRKGQMASLRNLVIGLICIHMLLFQLVLKDYCIKDCNEFLNCLIF